MFEGVVATILNRYLGKYIQDLDTENLNVGIFGGDVQLTELKLKPEALYELDLPIEVKVGTIGRINIRIPWGGLYNQSVVIEVEDVYLIAGPVTDRKYDPDKEKRLMRASKRKKIEDLEAENFLGADAPESTSFFESLITTIMSNLQVFVHSIHIRYEDSSLRSDSSFSCGLCIQNISIETTNSKWKSTMCYQGTSSVYQMIRIESLSIYCNPTVNNLVGSSPGLATAAPYTWRNDMKKGLETFSVNSEEFDFIVKPMTAKVKVIVNKSNEARVPKLLIDFVLQDAATQFTRQQYLAITDLADEFQRINVNRRLRQFHPGIKLSGNAHKWWKFAFDGIKEQRIQPYTWQRIQNHRCNYRRYRDVYTQTLLQPTNTELKLDLQQLEDQLDITNIIIAREHAKIQLSRSNPERVHIHEEDEAWWIQDLEEEKHTELKVITDKGRGIWAQLTSSEKSKLYEAIGYVDGAPARPEKPKQYIEHKMNFTLANCSLSLVNRGREILVLTLAQFLASVETRPSAKAFKASARIESFVMEGASIEHDLVPIVTADNILTGNTSSNFLSIDFERNPLTSEADYGLSVSLESVEIVYHEHALSELISFFQTPTHSLMATSKESAMNAAEMTKSVMERAICRHKPIQINLDLKLPYFVLPEMGSLQKGGNIAVVNLGHIRVYSELQPSNVSLEDATQMEIEEKLYDRFHLDYNDFHILFCDSGEEWRDAKKLQDSEFHLLPKIQCQVVFSNSVKPEYRQLPRHKLNVSVQNIKINLSDRKIGCVMDFIDNLPLPTANTVHVSASSSAVCAAANLGKDKVIMDLRISQLEKIKLTLVRAEMAKKSQAAVPINKIAAKMAMLEVDKTFISSEHSDEEMELWARTLDLPGFDDNVSPNNIITMLLRFVIGEVVIQLCRSSNRTDKPYLMLRISKIICDTALMEYGPAIQASVNSIQLIDKLHVGVAGEYLELIATETGTEVATLLYRKVQSNCPDFKSHFHSVEQSLVLDFSSTSIILHREAFVTLNKYLQYLLHKIQSRDICQWCKVLDYIMSVRKIWMNSIDPPIPPGATKFSYSTRMAQFRLRLCDTDVEFLELKISGLESDCLFKANERMVLRFYLTCLTIDDLSDMTLYPHVLAVEEDKVIDFKYVRHNPRIYRQSEIDAKQDDVKSDGSLKLHVGRIHLVLFFKMFVDLQHFIEPFVRPSLITSLVHEVKKCFSEQLMLLRGWNTKLHLSLDIHAPSLLLPQKLASPNLIIFNLGDLSVENFFKELVLPSSCTVDNSFVPVIDNILVRLESIQLSRAVMTLAGSLEVQEPIIDPISIRLDIKRTVAYHSAMNSVSAVYQPNIQLLLYQVFGGIDNIRINLGQRDLSTLLSVWTDNFNDGRFIGDVTCSWHPVSPLEPPTPIAQGDDPAVRKIQAFFSQSEQVRKEATLRLTLDGLQLYLFNDIDEILSSPVRDMNRGLCKFETGEASLSLDTFTDHSLEVKMALQYCYLEDIRPESSGSIKKIFQSHGGDLRMDNSYISVSTPPIVDITFRQTQTSDRCVDILIERTRLNLSMPFILELGRFILDALPGERLCEGGVINLGYVGDIGSQGKAPSENARPPSSTDSTSGYFSSGASCVDDQTGISISLQLRRPEIMLYSERGESKDSESRSHALLLRTEFLLDYSRHPGRDSLVCSVSGLHILSNNRKPHMVLHPCDIEFAKSFKIEDGLKITCNMSTVDFRLSSSTIHTLSDVFEEVNIGLHPEELDSQSNICHMNSEYEDLWSPKKITPYIYPQETEGFIYGDGCDVRLNETFTLCLSKVRLILELEDAVTKIPMILVKTAAEASIQDWSTAAHMKGEIQLQVSYFNGHLGVWEPLVEPCSEAENIYRPWEIQFKIFQGKAYLLSSHLDHEKGMNIENDMNKAKQQRTNLIKQNIAAAESETSADEQEPEAAAMMFIRRRDTDSIYSHQKNLHESVSLVGYPEDSDSENEEGIMEKLASAIGHLFTGDSSDGEVSESEESSGAEPSAETEDASEIGSTSVGAETVLGHDERAIFLKKHCHSVDSGLEAESVDHIATYVIIESRDRLELTVSPVALQVLSDLTASFSRQIPVLNQQSPPLILVNDITPNSTVMLLSKEKVDCPGQILMTASYVKAESIPSSPGSTSATDNFVDNSPSESDIDIESFEGGFSNIKNSEPNNGELFSPILRFPDEGISRLYNKITGCRLRIQIPEFEVMEVLCPQRSVSKMHLLHQSTPNNKCNARYHIVVSIKCDEFCQAITVRSPLQIKNETSYAMGIYYKKLSLEVLGIQHMGESVNPFEDTNKIAVIEPDETYNVPIHIAYHCKIYVLPAYVDSYSVSDSGLWWQDLAADLNTPKDIICLPKEEKDLTVFSVRAVCQEGPATNRVSRSIPNYFIKLLPPLAVHNRLPYAVEIKIPIIKYEIRIEAGEKANIYFLNLLKVHKIIIEVPSYLGIPWLGSFSLSPDLEEKIVAMATEHDTEGGNKQLGLSVKVERSETCEVILYAPYWIINKTALPLQIRASLSDVVYEAQGEEPLLFCYRKLRRRCVRLRAYHSSWSSAFSLDTVGSAGLIICSDRERKRRYRILMTVTFSCSSPHLTRTVTLLPNFLVINDSKRPLRFMEDNEKADLWIDIGPFQCVPFWPDTDSMHMFVKFRDSKVVSQHFPIAVVHQTILRMDKGCGLCVHVSGGGEHSFYITFRSYKPGDAPVRVDNLCEDLFLKIHQQQLGQVALLSPYQSLLYTWDDPSKERCLLWNVYNKKCKGFVADFLKDGYGQERVSFHMVKQQSSIPSVPATPTVTAKLSASLKRLSTPIQDCSSSSGSDDTESDELQKPQLLKKTRKDKVIVYWVSYLEGQQRILMFTQDERVAYQARKKIDAERSNIEIILSFRGIGLSLTNDNINGRLHELAYITINDSAALWEVNVAHRWKLLTLELASWIEDRWKQDCKRAQMKDYVHVDFEKMHMTKPFYGELRRRYYSAFWLQYRKSNHHSYINCRLHRLQIDNQQLDCVFPTVLYPTAVPPHIVRKFGVKPCLEFTVMKSFRPTHNQDVYKFIKVLLQEFSIQLDRSFIISVYDTLKPWLKEEKPSVRIRTDIALLHQPVSSKCTGSSNERKVIIEYMHLSPIKLQLSFSPRGTRTNLHNNSSLVSRSYTADLLHLLLDSLAPNLNDIKAIKFRMAYYEVQGHVVMPHNLVTDIYCHYSSQLAQQLHVLILGLDVLGNPYARVSDFTEGYGDLFYEPSLGMLESPEEFSQGLSQSAQMMMGHYIGGAANTNNLITSVISSQIHASFNEDYKKKHRICLQTSCDLPESLVASTKTFEMGVALGLSGVIMKPLIGCQQEGVEGFFRGIGKGLMGLLTKPSGGILDCTSMATDGIKRSIEMGEDTILRTRLPRYLNPYMGTKPFSLYEAIGMQLLYTLSKGHYADTDVYWAHGTLNPECKSTLLVTLQHIFLVEKCRVWGMWEVEWVVRVDDIMAVPEVIQDKLVFKVRQDESFNFFSGDERYIQCKDENVLQWLRNKIETVLILNMEDKPCPSADT